MPGSSKKAAGRKRRALAVVWSVAALVVAAVVAMFLLRGPSSSPGRATGTGTAPGTGGPKKANDVPPGVMDQVTGIPAATIDGVGAGGADISVPLRLPDSVPALTSAGKPEVLYVGAEYCPYCASQRWPLVQALSRFGSFSGLSASESSAVDVYPSTPTFSFYGSSFDSPYLVFTAVETATNEPQGNSYAPLQALTPAQEKILSTYDAPPYVAANSAGAIPFLDIGGRYLQSGSSVSPELMQGMSMEQVAGSLSRPGDRLGGDIAGSANLLTAAICESTGGKPTDVCTAPGVVAAAQRLGGT